MSEQLSAERLTNYFAGQDVGAAPSNYLEMCWATLAVSHTSVECRACDGKGFRELGLEELRKWAALIAEQKTPEHREDVRKGLSYASTCQVCRGGGFTTARRADRASAMDSMWTTVRCGRCRGCGEATPPTDTSAERGDVCLNCGGKTYIVPVTVRCRKQQGVASGGSATDSYESPLFLPTAAPEPASEHDYDDDRLSVAHELERLRATDPQLAAAVASYHGPESEPWVQHRWGRGFVLWQHTAPAQQLAEDVAERSPARAGYLVAVTKRLAEARLAVERPAAGRPPAHHQLWRVLVARADREARELQRRVLAFTTSVESAA
jgi:hypothetical protein